MNDVTDLPARRRLESVRDERVANRPLGITEEEARGFLSGEPPLWGHVELKGLVQTHPRHLRLIK